MGSSGSQALTIRPYRFSDRAFLQRCLADLQDYERGLDRRVAPGAEVAEAYLAYLQARCADECGAILVGELDGEPIGFVAVLAKVRVDDIEELGQDHGYVSDIFVLPRFRGQRFGAELLARAQAFAQENGARWLRIDVMYANAGARRLYDRAGFRPRLVSLEKGI